MLCLWYHSVPNIDVSSVFTKYYALCYYICYYVFDPNRKMPVTTFHILGKTKMMMLQDWWCIVSKQCSLLFCLFVKYINHLGIEDIKEKTLNQYSKLVINNNLDNIMAVGNINVTDRTSVQAGLVLGGRTVAQSIQIICRSHKLWPVFSRLLIGREMKMVTFFST